MILRDKNNKAVEVTVFGQRDDLQISSAVYLDSGEEAPDEIVDYLYDHYSDKLEQEWYENQLSAAESYHEDR